MNRPLRTILVASVLIALSACANRSPEFKSQGLEDLVSCRFDTEAAEVMFSSHITQRRGGTLEKVDLEIVELLSDEPDFTRDLVRPREGLIVFGARVHGLLFFSMHGSTFFVALAEGDFGDVQSELERRTGLPFAPDLSESLKTHSSPEIFLEEGISMGDFIFEKEIRARSLVIGAQKAPQFLLIGCTMELEN